MNAKVMLLSKKDGDIEKFLNKFLNKKTVALMFFLI